MSSFLGFVMGDIAVAGVSAGVAVGGGSSAVVFVLVAAVVGDATVCEFEVDV